MGLLVKVWNVGRINYKNALKLQQIIAKQHIENTKPSNIILILEHYPVYTIGIRRKEYTSEDAERLKKTGADYYETDRGGLITFHGFGQLVAYPIINLKHFNKTMRQYVCYLEKTVIDLCTKYNLDAATSPHTGVWIGDNKVCAIGVHGSRHITTHGLALNCNTDLSWYNHIVPCGIKDKGVTSLTIETNRIITIDDVIPEFRSSFNKVFDCEDVDLGEDEILEYKRLKAIKLVPLRGKNIANEEGNETLLYPAIIPPKEAVRKIIGVHCTPL